MTMLWIQSLYGPFTQDLELIVLVGPFQIRLFSEVQIRVFAMKSECSAGRGCGEHPEGLENMVCEEGVK